MSVTPALAAYKQLRPSMDTGDLLLFRGGGLTSTVIRWGQQLLGHHGPFSHVGMVYTLDRYDLVLCWESTTLGKATDVVLGTAVRGVRLTPLSLLLHTYPGAVWWRRLRGPRSAPWRVQVDAARRALHGRPYERSLRALLYAAWDSPSRTLAADLSSVFCSELVVETYQHAGLLRAGGPPAGEYTPNDLGPGGSFETRLVAGWTLGPAILLRPA